MTTMTQVSQYYQMEYKVGHTGLCHCSYLTCSILQRQQEYKLESKIACSDVSPPPKRSVQFSDVLQKLPAALDTKSAVRAVESAPFDDNGDDWLDDDNDMVFKGASELNTPVNLSSIRIRHMLGEGTGTGTDWSRKERGRKCPEVAVEVDVVDDDDYDVVF